MATPRRGKRLDIEGSERSPKNFRWSQPYEDTLLDLLVREARKSNRPDSSFTAIAFRNVVQDFNRIHRTTIMKKHVQSKIKTMKHHFVMFHGAFTYLSGFAWNPETKMFVAKDYLWEQKIQENPRIEKLCDQTCHNWDKLFELYDDTRATGACASSLKEVSKSLARGLEFGEPCVGMEDMNFRDTPGNASSSYGEHDFAKLDGAPASTSEYVSSHQSGGSSSCKLNRKSSLISMLKDGYVKMACRIDKLSMALSSTEEKVASSKFDVSQTSQIYEALASLGLEHKYRVRCYCYLCANASKAALLLGAPNAIRGDLLHDIMKQQEMSDDGCCLILA